MKKLLFVLLVLLVTIAPVAQAQGSQAAGPKADAYICLRVRGCPLYTATGQYTGTARWMSATPSPGGWLKTIIFYRGNPRYGYGVASQWLKLN